MSESSMTEGELMDFSFTGHDDPLSFPPASTAEARQEVLCWVAKCVFARRKMELAYELKTGQVLELIALIVSNTYAARGDSFQFADDEALARIHDLLLEHDPHIVRRYSHTQITEQQLIRQFRRSQGGRE